MFYCVIGMYCVQHIMRISFANIPGCFCKVLDFFFFFVFHKISYCSIKKGFGYWFPYKSIMLFNWHNDQYLLWFATADGFVVQTGDPQGPSEGFIDPSTEKARTIPLEIMVDGDKTPVYGATLEVSFSTHPWRIRPCNIILHVFMEFPYAGIIFIFKKFIFCLIFWLARKFVTAGKRLLRIKRHCNICCWLLYFAFFNRKHFAGPAIYFEVVLSKLGEKRRCLVRL